MFNKSVASFLYYLKYNTRLQIYYNCIMKKRNKKKKKNK